MTISQIKTCIRYITNTTGETTDVIVPVELWEQIMNSLKDNASGLALIDEQEPKTQILADLRESLREAAAGKHFPISELWDNNEI